METPEPKGHFNSEHLCISDLTGKLTDFILDYDTLILKIHDLSGMEMQWPEHT